MAELEDLVGFARRAAEREVHADVAEVVGEIGGRGRAAGLLQSAGTVLLATFVAVLVQLFLLELNSAEWGAATGFGVPT